MDLLLIIFLVVGADARLFCAKMKAPLELGKWKHDLKHLDSAVVDNPPVSISEGQMYVYENIFPNYTIKYIHVDNLAMRTCGGSASIKAGGVGSSSVLIVLKAHINQEIRSVVDIWGERETGRRTATRLRLDPDSEAKNIKSLDLFKNIRVGLGSISQNLTHECSLQFADLGFPFRDKYKKDNFARIIWEIEDF